MRPKFKSAVTGVKHQVTQVSVLVSKSRRVLVGALVSQSVADRLQVRADREGVTVSELIRQALGL
jgi:hypothetical protein